MNGLVQDMLMPEMQKMNPKDYDRVFNFFDSDSHEPTKFAMEAQNDFVRPGTFIYCDELFDFKERRLHLQIFND